MADVYTGNGPNSSVRKCSDGNGKIDTEKTIFLDTVYPDRYYKMQAKNMYMKYMIKKKIDRPYMWRGG